MIEVETYNNQANLYSREKAVENTQLRLSEKEKETASDIEKVVKHSNSKSTPMRKIRRTKSAGIF